MGIKNGGQIIFKMSNVVAKEIDLMLDVIMSNLPPGEQRIPSKQSIDCDISNIIHKISYRHSSIFSTLLVRDVAIFLKQLAADTGYIVNAILDGDVRPQTKRDAFRRRYDSTMARVNSFFCRQSAMKIAAKPENERTDEDRANLVEFNKEAKIL